MQPFRRHAAPKRQRGICVFPRFRTPRVFARPMPLTVLLPDPFPLVWDLYVGVDDARDDMR